VRANSQLQKIAHDDPFFIDRRQVGAFKTLVAAMDVERFPRQLDLPLSATSLPREHVMVS